MRFLDLLTLPIAALWQQKLRTLLTTLGVVFGAFVLAATLSISQGVQEMIDREFRRSDVARRVSLFSRWNADAARTAADKVTVKGTMSTARRERLQASIAGRIQQGNPEQMRVQLTSRRLNDVASLPHVQRVIPLFQEMGYATVGSKTEAADVAPMRPDDPACRGRIVAGRFFERPDQRGVIVSEYLAYQFGAVDEADVARLIGTLLRLEFRRQRPGPGIWVNMIVPGRAMNPLESAALEKLNSRLPELIGQLDIGGPEGQAFRNILSTVRATETEVVGDDYPIVGVIRTRTGEEERDPWDPFRADSDAILLLPYQTAAEIYLRGSGRGETEFHRAVAFVDSEAHVKQVVKRIKAMGLDAHAPIEFIDRQRLVNLLIFGGMTCVAAVALLVSALGIANTMLMSVLERTREIGVMKAVGAANVQLQWIFLFEGALIGLMGGGLGLMLAWSASYPADAWVRSIVIRDLDVKLKGSIFVFPVWIAATVMAFTVVVTTLAAAYPARHAARVDPVSALRHE